MALSPSPDPSSYPAEPDPRQVAAAPGETPAQLMDTTRQRKRTFLRAFRETGIIADGCQAARVSRRAVLRWCELDLKFRQAFLMAQENAADRVEQELYQRAMVGVEIPIFDKKTGMQLGSYLKKSDSLLTLLLKGMRPLKYKERVDTETKDKLTAIHDELQRLGLGEGGNERGPQKQLTAGQAQGVEQGRVVEAERVVMVSEVLPPIEEPLVELVDPEPDPQSGQA